MDEKAIKLKNTLAMILSALLLLSVLFLLRGYFKGYYRSPETLQEYLKTFGIAAPVILVVIQAVQVVLPVLPGFLGCIVGAGMFGAMGGFWCNYIGISLGSLAAFFLAKKYGVELVKRMLPMERYHKFAEWMKRRKSYTLVLFLAILLPLAPDDFLCYFSGLIGMSSKRFVWIIVLAKPWCILAYCLAFAKLI